MVRRGVVGGLTVKQPPFTIVIDTAEQLPLEFPGLATVRQSLYTGDYSLVGYENRVTVERKSKEDAWKCVASDRTRFECCIERMAAFERSAIVIECTQREFAKRPDYIQRVTPGTAVGSYISWSVKHNIQLFWCDNRAYAARTVVRYLAGYLKHVANGTLPL